MGLYRLTRVRLLTSDFIELRSKIAAEQHSASQGGLCRYEGAAGAHYPSDHVLWTIHPRVLRIRAAATLFASCRGRSLAGHG